MDRNLDPRHDRVRLTAHELTALVDLERALSQEEVNEAARRWPWSWLKGSGRMAGHILRRWVRWAPSLVLLSLLAMPIAILVSSAAGALCALILTAAVTTWVVASRDRLRARLVRGGPRGASRDR
jgi:hypothetical protein